METPAGDRTTPPGVVGALRNFAASTAAHAEKRLALVGIECREAALHAAILAGVTVAAAVAVLMGYLLLLAGIGIWIAATFEWAWWLVLCAGGLLHFALAAAAAAWIRCNFQKPVFTATLNELKKDASCLRESMKNSD